MPQTAKEETLQQILRGARDAGYPVSRAQLRRYRDEGLLPRPRRRGLGRGRGIEPLYPAGSSRQLVTICRYLQRRRSFRVVRWVLWWDGYSVSEEWIRELLSLRVAAMVESRRAWLAGERDVVGVLESTALVRLADPLPARMRRRTGRKRFPTFLWILAQLVLGIPPTLEDDDAEILAKGLGFVDSQGIEALLPTVAETLDPRKLQEALEASSWEVVEVARDQLRGLMRWIEALPPLMGASLDRPLEEPFQNALLQPTIDENVHRLLIWLSIKRSPWAQQVYELGMSMLRGVASGTMSPQDALQVEFPLEREDHPVEGPSNE